MMDHDDIEAARNRLPEPADDREDEVDRALRERERVGFQNGRPLASVPYGKYPDDILKPSAGDVFREVCEHERVTEPKDVAQELHTSTERVRKGAKLHGAELPSGASFDVDVGDPFIDVPLWDNPVHLEDLANPPHEDHRLIYHLVVTCGMGVSEVVTFLERAVNDARGEDEPRYTVSEQDVTDTLRRMNLLDGPTSDEREARRRARGPGADEVNRHTSTTVDITEHEPDDYEGGSIVANDIA